MILMMQMLYRWRGKLVQSPLPHGGDSPEANGKYDGHRNFIRQRHLQPPDHRHRQTQHNHVRHDVEGPGQDVRQDLVPAAPAGDRLVPVEGERPAEEEAAEDNAQAPESDGDGGQSRHGADPGHRHVEDAHVEEQDRRLGEQQTGCPQDLHGNQILNGVLLEEILGNLGLTEVRDMRCTYLCEGDQWLRAIFQNHLLGMKTNAANNHSCNVPN